LAERIARGCQRRQRRDAGENSGAPHAAFFLRTSAAKSDSKSSVTLPSL
jgi:hypothetical protein